MTDLQYRALQYILEKQGEDYFGYTEFTEHLKLDAPMHRRTDKHGRAGNFTPSWAGRYIGKMKQKGWVKDDYDYITERWTPYLTKEGKEAMTDYVLNRNETEIP